MHSQHRHTIGSSGDSHIFDFITTFFLPESKPIFNPETTTWHSNIFISLAETGAKNTTKIKIRFTKQAEINAKMGYRAF